MAGLITCLWQAFPDFTNMEIIQAVIKSSSIYNAPNDRIGYGIPNFHIAFDDLNQQQRSYKNMDSILGNKMIKVFPNPFTNNFMFLLNPKTSGPGTFAFYDALGNYYYSKQLALQKGQTQFIKFNNLQPLSKRTLYSEIF